MKVLVCGGRDYSDFAHVCSVLNEVDASLPKPGITLVISGCAPGADTLAVNWTKKFDVSVQLFPARWREEGKAAGPLRNQRMLDHGKPDLVVAFPGGRGTADMVRRAKAAGVEVREIQKRNTG